MPIFTEFIYLPLNRKILIGKRHNFINDVFGDFKSGTVGDFKSGTVGDFKKLNFKKRLQN